MVILDSELLLKFSGGASQSDPNLSLGGAISSVSPTDNSLHNLFDLITGAESGPGDVEYRGLYFKNNNSTLTAQVAKIYILTDVGSEFDIGLDLAGLNAEMDTIVDESTAPSPAVSFSHPTDYANGLSFGNVPATQFYGFWVRRTIPSSASAETPHTAVLKIEVDSDA
jgi:hypothetical protein